jgi:hypothetical protein
MNSGFYFFKLGTSLCRVSFRSSWTKNEYFPNVIKVKKKAPSPAGEGWDDGYNDLI